VHGTPLGGAVCRIETGPTKFLIPGGIFVIVATDDDDVCLIIVYASIRGDRCGHR
jgi:hypothetical protein